MNTVAAEYIRLYAELLGGVGAVTGLPSWAPACA